jgi:hypothetical protein
VNLSKKSPSSKDITYTKVALRVTLILPVVDVILILIHLVVDLPRLTLLGSFFLTAVSAFLLFIAFLRLKE